MMRQGFSLVWFGWQADVLPGDDRLTMQVPVARPYQPTDAERKAWRANVKALGDEARNGFGVVEGLRALRGES